MDLEHLVKLHPQLFHMAVAGSWPAIAQHGLLPTRTIVETSDLGKEEMSELLDQRRAKSVRIQHPQLGDVVVRDQGPLNLTHLEPKLIDVTVQGWLNILNDRVFFWLHPDKLAGLLTARRYRSSVQDVLTVDTRSLLKSAVERVRLSPINSGAALYPNATPRGSDTFLSIADYDYAARKRARGSVDAIVELAVIGGVPDIADHVVSVRRMRGLEELGEYSLG
ncbi:hypothetical protein [Herbiconiux sp. L3-i23]|uniref:DUF7002 family protein n=1 Tax=Herbiconiux sp. L3-i23 TaxID=2905871 RepID=UPI00205985EF|nr:hypothetical protein [Herbiconiux sp. L3-i23]BDI23496.1 hypothetical protein L3i23_22720 [Herbiconiux sp. L3-i23]